VTINDHAIRRYKKRFGKKRLSKRKVIALINKDLRDDVIGTRKCSSPGYYIMKTSKYNAVCYKNRVITIMLPFEQEWTTMSIEDLTEVDSNAV
jgi:hypothetical protein